MRTLSLFTCLALITSQNLSAGEEIAALFLNKDASTVNELQKLNTQMTDLKSQIETLRNQLEESMQSKDQVLRAYIRTHLSHLKSSDLKKGQELENLKTEFEKLHQKVDELTPSSEVACQDQVQSAESVPVPEVQPIPVDTCMPQLNPGYAYPAGIKTHCGYNLRMDASFTYWQASQDNMEVGDLDHQFFHGSVTFGDFILPHFSYAPGFKLGGGMQFDYDNWDTTVTYSWYRNKTTGNKTVSPAPNFPQDYFQIWPLIGSGEVILGSDFTAEYNEWNLRMDIIEAALGRWQYVGTKLTCHPYAGLRAAIIRQNRFVKYTHPVVPPPISNAGPILEARNNIHSWAIGPEIGLDLSWQMVKEFRLLTGCEVDLLYTQYTRIHDTTTNTLDPTLEPDWIANTESNYNCVRPHVDMTLGLGWGTYSLCRRFYFDFSALYELQVFFDQNLFRSYYGGDTHRNGLTTIGNLYLQGLTFNCDFHY